MKNIKYHIKLDKYDDEGAETESSSIEFDFENHDDIFKVIALLKERKRFSDDQQATEFAVGLKLFSEVMLRNRDSELFKDFVPAFGAFIKKLKAK